MNTKSFNQRRDESVLLRLSMRTRMLLEAILNSSVASQAREQAEREMVAERSALGQQLVALDGPYLKESAKLSEQYEKTKKALEDAHEKTKAALADYNRASMSCYGRDQQYAAARGAILRELEASCDPRIDVFRAKCDGLIGNQLQLALIYWFAGRPSELKSNVEDVRAACQKLEKAKAFLLDVKLMPLGYAEVTERLMSVCAELADALAPLKLNPPSLIGSEHEIGEPLAWTGSPTWFSDEAIPPPQQERAVMRA